MPRIRLTLHENATHTDINKQLLTTASIKPVKMEAI